MAMNGGPARASLFAAPDQLWQDINRGWTNWFNPTVQYGTVNFNLMQSGSPRTERAIVENVASYGRQLGRISEVLCVLLKRGPRDAADEHAIAVFREMMREIAAVKAGQAPVTAEDVRALCEGLGRVRAEDAEAFERLAAPLRDLLKVKR